MATRSYRVGVVRWDEVGAQIREIRVAVFAEEHALPATFVRDDIDPRCVHVLARAEDGAPVGAGRLHIEGELASISRMAVLTDWRRHGVGNAVLGTLLAEAKRQGVEQVFVHAPEFAQRYYARHGFAPDGPLFLEGDLPHRRMTLRLG